MAAVLVHDRVDVWDAPRVMLLGVRVQVRPDGETALVSVTVPVKPFIGATVMVEVAAAPALVEAVAGLAETEKSGDVTVNATVTE